MAGKDGTRLSEDEVKEYLSYVDQGLAPPDKFDDVVFDASSITGAVYRWKTADEREEGNREAKAAVKDSAAREELLAKARDNAAKAADRAGQNPPSTTRVPVGDAGGPDNNPGPVNTPRG